MCNWPAGVFGNSLFSKANKKKRCKSREMPALIKLHRSVFIDTLPGGSQRDSQSWRECGKHTRQLSEEAMIPTITGGGGIKKQGGVHKTAQRKYLALICFVKRKNVHAKRICKVSSALTYTHRHTFCLKAGFCFIETSWFLLCFWAVPSVASEEIH